jgi:hypothetical protein
LDEPAHGLWCSFTSAHFPDLTAALAAWTQRLEPGGWLAMTEIADMFGHEPLDPRTAALLSAYERKRSWPAVTTSTWARSSRATSSARGCAWRASSCSLARVVFSVAYKAS